MREREGHRADPVGRPFSDRSYRLNAYHSNLVPLCFGAVHSVIVDLSLCMESVKGWSKMPSVPHTLTCHFVATNNLLHLGL